MYMDTYVYVHRIFYNETYVHGDTRICIWIYVHMFFAFSAMRYMHMETYVNIYGDIYTCPSHLLPLAPP